MLSNSTTEITNKVKKKLEDTIGTNTTEEFKKLINIDDKGTHISRLRLHYTPSRLSHTQIRTRITAATIYDAHGDRTKTQNHSKPNASIHRNTYQY